MIYVAWGLGILVLGGLIGVAVYFYMQRRAFNKNIVVFEKVAGRYEPVLKDKARETKVGLEGATCFQTLRTKRYLPTPSIQVGRNTYWFVKRDDGYWVNFDLEDIDVNMAKAKVHYTHPDMRYAHAGLGRMIKDRFNKPSFWQQHGSTIVALGYIVIVAIMFVYISGSYLKITNTLSDVLKLLPDLISKMGKVMSSMDNVCSGSGIVSAG